MLRALKIMGHFGPLLWVMGRPATGLLKTRPFMGGRYLLQVRDSVQEADPTVDQHALETEPRAMQERQPGGREASAALKGGRDSWGVSVRGSGAVARAALQHSCGAVRGDCARGHGRACGSAPG